MLCASKGAAMRKGPATPRLDEYVGVPRDIVEQTFEDLDGAAHAQNHDCSHPNLPDVCFQLPEQRGFPIEADAMSKSIGKHQVSSPQHAGMTNTKPFSIGYEPEYEGSLLNMSSAFAEACAGPSSSSSSSAPARECGKFTENSNDNVVKLPSLTGLTDEEQKVIQELDLNGDGHICLHEVISGVKKQVESHRRIRSLQRQQIFLVLGAVVATGVAAAMMFGMSFAATWKAKSLFLSSNASSPGNSIIVDGEGQLVTVAEAKVALPLGLAPFLSTQQLLDIEAVGYYDCAAREEVLGRVVSVRRHIPPESENLSAAVVPANYTHATLGNYSVAFVLAHGQHLIMDSDGGYLDFPNEHRTQELCGELRLAQLHLKVPDIQKIQQRAVQAFPATGVSGLSEWKAKRRFVRRGSACRRCGIPPNRPSASLPPTTQAPTSPPTHPPVCSGAPQTLTPVQVAAVEVAQAICLMLSKAPSRDSRADIMGGLVKLAFHDAVTFDGSSGGADGCVDFNMSENRGLIHIRDRLSSVVKSVSGRLSRADVWALSAAVAIEAAGGPQLSFSVGREDNDNCSGQTARLPNAELNVAHIRTVFVDRLHFTERAVVALFGAHVLGRAVPANSGYKGKWVSKNDRFTNQYFRDLLLASWNKEAQPLFNNHVRIQWNGPSGTLMLNTDVEIAYDTSRGCNRAGGRGSRCPRGINAFSAAVTEFSVAQDVFFAEFTIAFRYLLALGSSTLTCAFPDCSTPGPL